MYFFFVIGMRCVLNILIYKIYNVYSGITVSWSASYHKNQTYSLHGRKLSAMHIYNYTTFSG